LLGVPPVDGIPVLGGFDVADERTNFCLRAHARLRYFAAGLLNRYEVPTARLSAEDVAQEIIAVVFAKWPTIATDPHALAVQRQRQREKYMFTAARRMIWRAAEQGKRFTSSAPDGSGPDGSADESHGLQAALERALLDAARIPATAGSQPERAAEHRELAEQVDAAMAQARLSDQQRQMVERTYRDDQTQASVAAQMGVTEGQVASQLHRARKKLTPALTALGVAAAALLAVFAGVAGAGRVLAAVARVLDNPPSRPGLVTLDDVRSLVLALVLQTMIWLRRRRERTGRPRPRGRIWHRRLPR
jgi:RNA polymerase sigma factor (sigma-70 family)